MLDLSWSGAMRTALECTKFVDMIHFDDPFLDQLY